MRDLRESVGSQDGLITARSGVKDTGQRLGKPSGASRSSSVGYARQVSEPVTHDEQETITVNGEMVGWLIVIVYRVFSINGKKLDRC